MELTCVCIIYIYIYICIYMYIYVYICICVGKLLPEKAKGHQNLVGDLWVQGITIIFFFVDLLAQIQKDFG